MELNINKEAKFWDRIAKRYAKQPVSDENSYQRKLQVIREYLRTDMEVLEFGCGTGSTAIALSTDVNKIRAIDISPKMIEIARRKAGEEKVENITFECATLDELNVSVQSFDAVMAFSVLHLLEDKEAIFDLVYRILKPGGIFVSSTACIGDSMRFFRIVAPVGRFLGLLPLLKVFTTRDLLDSLINAGFEVDHQWQPGKNKGVFIVARKVEQA